MMQTVHCWQRRWMQRILQTHPWLTRIQHASWTASWARFLGLRHVLAGLWRSERSRSNRKLWLGWPNQDRFRTTPRPTMQPLLHTGPPAPSEKHVNACLHPGSQKRWLQKMLRRMRQLVVKGVLIQVLTAIAAQVRFRLCIFHPCLSSVLDHWSALRRWKKTVRSSPSAPSHHRGRAVPAAPSTKLPDGILETGIPAPQAQPLQERQWVLMQLQWFRCRREPLLQRGSGCHQ
mmetsp:Transcript_31818/g.74316  ORF Transcript_31818/g.74316 Transcript_31818/m.74316 type:complete len:232 (+) Transcript_31818:1910-2605(+)